MGCGPSSQAGKSAVPPEGVASADGIPYSEQDYEDLIYLAKKREVKVTIQKSTQAGIAAGLCVMGGVLVAGPVGAAVGGAVGTAMAVKISKHVVPLNKLLEDTPANKRGEIVRLFAESFQEEFRESVQSNAELKLLLSGATPIAMVRYMVDKELIQNEQMKRLDGVLTKITG